MTRLNASRRKQDGIEPAASPPNGGTAPQLAEGSEAAPIWVTAPVDREAKTELHRDERQGRDAQSGVMPAGVAE
jgi:hypothetical protein